VSHPQGFTYTKSSKSERAAARRNASLSTEQWLLQAGFSAEEIAKMQAESANRLGSGK
jgi:hypothetical protein